MIGPNTLLFSPATGAVRAWTRGPSTYTECMCIDTLWLPPLRIGPNVLVATQRGLVRASEVTEDDWLCIAGKEMPDRFFPTEWPLCMGGSTELAHYWYHFIFQTRPVSLLDMMECPDHVAHWRNDNWLIELREEEPWYKNFAQRSGRDWLLRVMGIRRTFDSLVTLQGQWEAYGIPVSA